MWNGEVRQGMEIAPPVGRRPVAPVPLAAAGLALVALGFFYAVVEREPLFAAIAGGGVALWIAFFWWVLPVRTRLACADLIPGLCWLLPVP